LPTKVEKLETRVSEHDRRFAAINKLIITGMKMINENQAAIKALAASQRETDRMLKALAASQRETDRIVKDLARSLGRGPTNGHDKKTNIE
jgi:hypothetical protein